MSGNPSMGASVVAIGDGEDGGLLSDWLFVVGLHATTQIVANMSPAQQGRIRIVASPSV
jgi:hypothetical protein